MRMAAKSRMSDFATCFILAMVIELTRSSSRCRHVRIWASFVWESVPRVPLSVSASFLEASKISFPLKANAYLG